MAADVSDRERILRIIETYIRCDEEPTEEAVRRQYRYETGRLPCITSQLADRMSAGCIRVRKRLKARRLTESQ